MRQNEGATKDTVERYALVVLDNVIYHDSPLEPDEFLKELIAIQQIVGSASRKHFQVWHHSGLWFPIYGVENGVPVIELMQLPKETCRRIREQEFAELGHKAMKLYLEWKRRVNQCVQQIVGRKDCGQSTDHLVVEKAHLERDIRLIDDIVDTIPNADLRELFHLRYQKGCELEKIVHLVHYSSSTANRYTSELKRMIGADLHRILSNDEIEEKFHIEWQFEKWRFGRHSDI